MKAWFTLGRRLTVLGAALLIAGIVAGPTLLAQLPGPPVGAPQANQSPLYGYNFQYTFIPNNTAGAGVRFFPTLSLSTITGQTQDLVLVGGTITNPNSTSSVTQGAALHVNAPTCTANGGTFTTCANLIVDANPSGASNNVAMWVKGDIRTGSATFANTLFLGGGESCGASLAAGGTCGNTTATNFHVVTGTYLLSGSTSAVTGISPAFTSSTSWNCVANDITTRANPVQAIPQSGTAFTITNTTGATDLISVICAGT